MRWDREGKCPEGGDVESCACTFTSIGTGWRQVCGSPAIGGRGGCVVVQN